MTAKPGRNEELPTIKPHDPLITCSSNFDFSYIICRFRMQSPKLLPVSITYHRSRGKKKSEDELLLLKTQEGLRIWEEK